LGVLEPTDLEHEDHPLVFPDSRAPIRLSRSEHAHRTLDRPPRWGRLPAKETTACGLAAAGLYWSHPAKPCGPGVSQLRFRVFLGECMVNVTKNELEVAELIINTLRLEDVSAQDIEPDAPLFGQGLGLDSIDALEISLAISKSYGFQIRSDDQDNRRIFASLRALALHIQTHRVS